MASIVKKPVATPLKSTLNPKLGAKVPMAKSSTEVSAAKKLLQTKLELSAMKKPATLSSAVKATAAVPSKVVKTSTPIKSSSASKAVLPSCTPTKAAVKPASTSDSKSSVVKRSADSTTKLVVKLVSKTPTVPKTDLPAKTAVIKTDVKKPLSSPVKVTSPAPATSKVADTKPRLASAVKGSVVKTPSSTTKLSTSTVKPAVSATRVSASVAKPVSKTVTKTATAPVKSIATPTKPISSKPSIKPSTPSKSTAKLSSTLKNIRTRPATTDVIKRLQDDSEIEVRDADSTTIEAKTADDETAQAVPIGAAAHIDEKRAYVVAEQLLGVMPLDQLEEITGDVTEAQQTSGGSSFIIDMSMVELEDAPKATSCDTPEATSDCEQPRFVVTADEEPQQLSTDDDQSFDEQQHAEMVPVTEDAQCPEAVKIEQVSQDVQCPTEVEIIQDSENPQSTFENVTQDENSNSIAESSTERVVEDESLAREESFEEEDLVCSGNIGLQVDEEIENESAQFAVLSEIVPQRVMTPIEEYAEDEPQEVEDESRQLVAELFFGTDKPVEEIAIARISDDCNEEQQSPEPTTDEVIDDECETNDQLVETTESQNNQTYTIEAADEENPHPLGEEDVPSEENLPEPDSTDPCENEADYSDDTTEPNETTPECQVKLDGTHFELTQPQSQDQASSEDSVIVDQTKDDNLEENFSICSNESLSYAEAVRSSKAPSECDGELPTIAVAEDSGILDDWQDLAEKSCDIATAAEGSETCPKVDSLYDTVEGEAVVTTDERHAAQNETDTHDEDHKIRHRRNKRRNKKSRKAPENKDRQQLHDDMYDRNPSPYYQGENNGRRKPCQKWKAQRAYCFDGHHQQRREYYSGPHWKYIN